MTRIRDRAGYGRPLPARLWCAGLWLFPRWAWRRWPRTVTALAAAAVLAVSVLAAGGHGQQQCHQVPSRYGRAAGTCR